MHTNQVDDRTVFDSYFRMDPEKDAEDRLALKREALKDYAEFSDSALSLWNNEEKAPLWDGSFSLDRLQSRIRTVRGEISAIWNSALPDMEKARQIGARKNEIALLQAGQFTFSRAMTTRRV